MVLGTVILVLAIFVYFNLAQPEFDSVQQVRSEYLGRQQTLDTQEKAVRQVRGLIDKSKLDQGSDSNINFVLPTDPDVANAVAQVSGIADQCNLKLQLIGVNLLALEPATGDAVAQPLGTLIVQGRLTGDYAGIKRFFQGVETNIRLMDVRAISLQSASVKPEDDIYNLEFNIAAHYQPLAGQKTNLTAK